MACVIWPHCHLLAEGAEVEEAGRAPVSREIDLNIEFKSVRIYENYDTHASILLVKMIMCSSMFQKLKKQAGHRQAVHQYQD